MQLSKFTDYSFRALIYLAHNNERLCTVEELATNLHVSEHHLKKIIHKLAKTEYITSSKGRTGGLKLGIDPELINLKDVLKVTEDNLNIAECFEDGRACSCTIQNGCRLKLIMKDGLESFFNEFSKYTLKDIL